MFTIFLLISYLIIIINVAWSANLNESCKFEAHILKPSIKHGGQMIKPHNASEMEIVEIPYGDEIVLSCDEGTFFERKFKQITGLCKGVNTIEINGKDRQYSKFECDFDKFLTLKYEHTEYCPSPRISIRLGIVRKHYEKAAVIYELCYNETTLRPTFIHYKIREVINIDATEYTAITIENDNYFTVDNNNNYNDSYPIKKQQLINDINTLFTELNEAPNFGYKIKNPFTLEDSFVGLYTTTTTTTTIQPNNNNNNSTNHMENVHGKNSSNWTKYIWILLKHSNKAYVRASLLNGGGANSNGGKQLCENKVPEKRMRKNRRKSIRHQYCEYYDMKKVVNELPHFDEHIEFVAGVVP